MVWYSGDLGTNQLNKTQFCHKKVMHKGYQNQNQSPSKYIRGCQLILMGANPRKKVRSFHQKMETWNILLDKKILLTRTLLPRCLTAHWQHGHRGEYPCKKKKGSTLTRSPPPVSPWQRGLSLRGVNRT